jgi:hypothetical protein
MKNRLPGLETLSDELANCDSDYLKFRAGEIINEDI